MTYLVVGLANPGKQYEQTRHNVGERFVRAALSRLESEGIDIGEFRQEGNYRFSRVKYKSEDLIFVIPETFMNLSGAAVAAAKNFYKVAGEQIIVVSDDVNLEVGLSRLRFGGSDGGHNGLKSVIGSIGEGFWRIRIGIGINDIPLEDFVLAKPTDAQSETIDEIIDEQARNMLELISKSRLTNDTSKIN